MDPVRKGGYGVATMKPVTIKVNLKEKEKEKKVAIIRAGQHLRNPGNHTKETKYEEANLSCF